MWNLILFAFFSLTSLACFASAGETRPLDAVFSQASVIVRGAVMGSGVGPCGGREGNYAYYTLRVTSISKGEVKAGDYKVCTAAPLLLGSDYILAGNKHSDTELVFPPDAALLIFSEDRFYRLISFDGPIVSSDRGEAYAVGTLAPHFIERFGDLLKLEGD